MIKPNFIIAGAPRCGTTSVYYRLALHPDIFMASQKEIHFFDQYFNKGLRWYCSYFQDYNDEKAIGEKTAGYFFRKNVASRIKSTLPNLKLIFLFRNPVDRAYCHYWAWMMSGKINPEMGFEECIKSYPELIEIGKYEDHIRMFMKHFDKKNFLFLLLDELIENPIGLYKKIYNCLEVGYNFEILKNKIPTNKSGVINHKLIMQFIKKNVIYNKFLKDTIPRKLKDILREKLIGKKPAMQKNTRKYLLELYKPYNKRFAQLTGLNIDNWNK